MRLNFLCCDLSTATIVKILAIYGL